MITRDMTHPVSAHKDINIRLHGICPLFMANIAECYYNISKLESVRQALYLCDKHFEQCSVFRKHSSLR